MVTGWSKDYSVSYLSVGEVFSALSNDFRPSCVAFLLFNSCYFVCIVKLCLSIMVSHHLLFCIYTVGLVLCILDFLTNQKTLRLIYNFND